jgi:hypothetical protein
VEFTPSFFIFSIFHQVFQGATSSPEPSFVNKPMSPFHSKFSSENGLLLLEDVCIDLHKGGD